MVSCTFAQTEKDAVNLPTLMTVHSSASHSTGASAVKTNLAAQGCPLGSAFSRSRLPNRRTSSGLACSSRHPASQGLQL